MDMEYIPKRFVSDSGCFVRVLTGGVFGSVLFTTTVHVVSIYKRQWTERTLL